MSQDALIPSSESRVVSVALWAPPFELLHLPPLWFKTGFKIQYIFDITSVFDSLFECSGFPT